MGLCPELWIPDAVPTRKEGDWMCLELRNREGRPYANYLFKPTGDRFPLVVFLWGSGVQSALGFATRRLVPIAAQRGFALVVPDKVGVMSGSDPRPDFFAYDYKEERVRNANQLIDALQRDHGPFDGIHVVGFSEGADVAAMLARSRSDVHSVSFLGGGGLDAADEARLGLRSLLPIRNASLLEWNNRVLDRYICQLTALVLQDPSEKRMLMGHTYRRWASYLRTAAVDDLVLLDIPILSLHGDRDRNCPIESSRHVRDRLFAAQRRNHTLKEFAGLDHNFRDCRGQDRLGQVLEFLFGWILRKEG